MQNLTPEQITHYRTEGYLVLERLFDADDLVAAGVCISELTEQAVASSDHSQIMELEPEKWYGPVLSGYGTHLVYVHVLQAFPLPTFEQVSDRVREDRVTQKREELNDEYIESLLKRYNVAIEGDDGETGKAIGTGVSQ